MQDIILPERLDVRILGGPVPLPGENIQILILSMKAISWNSLYSSPHWSVRSKLAKEVHWQVFAACREQKIKPVKVCKLIITAFFKGKRKHDNSNICEKLLEDGLVAAGIISDDNSDVVTQITKRIVKNSNQDKIEIVIEEVVD